MPEDALQVASARLTSAADMKPITDDVGTWTQLEDANSSARRLVLDICCAIFNL